MNENFNYTCLVPFTLLLFFNFCFYCIILIKRNHVTHNIGEQGESTHLPPMWPRFKSLLRLHIWVEFAVASLPCSERFFSGYSGFPLTSKTNISKFQFDQKSGRRRTTLWMCYLQNFIIIIILLLL